MISSLLRRDGSLSLLDQIRSIQGMYFARAASSLAPDVVQALSSAVDGRLSVNNSVLDQHGRDESYHE